MKWSTTVPTAQQITQIDQLLEDGLRLGALGIGAPVGDAITGVTSTETRSWQALAAKYDRAVFLHGRFSSQQAPTTGILGFEELLANVGVYGGGLMLQHMHQQALGESQEALNLVDDARAKGLSVVAEIYPYSFGATMVAADYLHPDNYGPNMGRGYKDIIETATLKPLTKERYDELIKTAPGTSVMFYGATEKDMLAALAHPGIPYVVVNGTIVVKDSKVLKGVYPGKAVRRSVMQ